MRRAALKGGWAGGPFLAPLPGRTARQAEACSRNGKRRAKDRPLLARRHLVNVQRDSCTAGWGLFDLDLAAAFFDFLLKLLRFLLADAFLELRRSAFDGLLAVHQAHGGDLAHELD